MHGPMTIGHTGTRLSPVGEVTDAVRVSGLFKSHPAINDSRAHKAECISVFSSHAGECCVGAVGKWSKAQAQCDG